MRPRLLTTLLLVPIAIILTFTVSVAIALASDFTGSDPVGENGPRERARIARFWTAARPEGFPERSNGEESLFRLTPGYAYGHAFATETDAYYRLIRPEAGWPLPALHGAFWQKTDLVPDPTLVGSPMMIAGRTEHLEGMTMVRPGHLPFLRISSVRYVPLRIAWTGAVVDVVLIFGVLWLAALALIRLRARRRLGGGCCPACGYPIGTASRCSECGRAVRAVSESI